MILQPGDLLYASYPRKRDDRTKPSVLHDRTWGDNDRTQQQIHRRRTDPNGQHFIDITSQVERLIKTGKRIDVELTGGERATCDEYGESQPGMLIGRVRDEDGA